MKNLKSTFIYALILGSLTACTPLPQKADQPTDIERVYSATPEEIQRAIKQVMLKYPQRVDNLEEGIFETDYIKGEQRWHPPDKLPDKPGHFGAGYRYRILIHILKGKRDGKFPVVKAIVTKAIEDQADFFSDADPRSSDGLEELTILYRIQREISMAKAAERAQERLNQKSRDSYQK